MTAKQLLLKWLAEDDLQKVITGLFFLADKYKEEQLRNQATAETSPHVKVSRFGPDKL